MYNAIKAQQILQPLSASRSSVSSLSPGSNVLRNRSLRSQPDRLTTLKRGSIRGIQSIMGVQAGHSPYSSNSSIDGRVSPSPSFATSLHEVGTRHRLCFAFLTRCLLSLTAQLLRSCHQLLALHPTYRIPLYGRLKKMMTGVYVVQGPPTLASV